MITAILIAVGLAVASVTGGSPAAGVSGGGPAAPAAADSVLGGGPV